MKTIHSSFGIKICFIFLFFSFTNEPFASDAAPEVSQEDFREIITSIANKVGGKKLILKNIARDHTGENTCKSYFYSADLTKIEALIDSAVSSPTGYLYSSGKIKIVKDFTPEEAFSFFSTEYIGVDISAAGPGKPPTITETNRVLLCFSIDELLSAGRPWDGKKGVLLTGYPLRESVGVNPFTSSK